MSSTDHLANAREYIAIAESGDSKREAYRKAGREISAAFADGMSFTAIARELGRSDKWVGDLARWAEGALATGTDLPFERDSKDTHEIRQQRDAERVLEDAQSSEKVIRNLSDDARDRLVDTAIKVTAQEATAKAREHQTEPTLADVGPIHDRTEYELDVLLVKVWRWARVLRQLVETRGVWVAEDRFDEALQRAQELESAVAEVRAAIEEAVNERSMA